MTAHQDMGPDEIPFDEPVEEPPEPNPDAEPSPVETPGPADPKPANAPPEFLKTHRR